MPTVFDKQTVDMLLSRIAQLEPGHRAQWGKMDCSQMLRHCTISEESFLGKRTLPRLFVGRLFGGFALKAMLRNENPLPKNQPTHPQMKIWERGNFEAEKSRWISLLPEYLNYSAESMVHPFFGKMSREQVGRMVYKHVDHHLRQFGV